MDRMDKEEVKEGQWQGFQQFQDLSEGKHTQFPEINRMKTISSKEEQSDNKVQIKTAYKSKFSPRKKSDNRVELPIDQNSGLQKLIKPVMIIMNKTEQQKAPQQPRKIEQRRYQRIPIIKYEQDCRYAGKIVYKNFVPRSSDNYLKILKQVDWKNEISEIYMGLNSIANLKEVTLTLPLKVSDLQYDLYMRVDSNTSGHRQWFYFSMKNEKKCKVKLHIFRFKKMYSLYQRGMRPYFRSRKSEGDWRPAGDSVFYHYQRQGNQYGLKKEAKSFILTFNYTFEHQNDEVFVAAGIPYTYTYLQKQLTYYRDQLQKRQNLKFQIGVLAKSMCGLDLQIITVEHRMAKLVHIQTKKKFIVVNARTHSGQTSCSWVLDGMLMELSQSLTIQQWMLSENITLKIIPMLNPDGVFIGNYRTGIIGDDFNRKFNSGRKQFYPQIYALKKLISTCKKEGDVELFLDLHGHSILKNSFIYGPAEGDASHFRMKNLPYHLFHNSKYFRLASCKLKTERENRQTARVYFQLKEQILTFTCQNSLGLYYHQRQTFQMLAGDWQAFGKSILHSMKDIYCNREISIPQQPNQSKFQAQKQKQKLPPKPSIMSEIEKKIGTEQIKLKSQTSKSNKNEKIHFKLPSTKIEAVDKLPKNSFSFSQQINRQDDIVQSREFSFIEKEIKNEEKSPEGKVAFKIRRKSEIMKVPTHSLVKKLISKNREVNVQEEEQNEFYLGRSSTFDTSQALKREIEKTNKQYEQSQPNQYDMEIIKENFSDEYCSINDSDSSEQNLPDQQRNYIFQYIKSNQHKMFINDEEEEERSYSQKCSIGKKIKQPKISKFREIRFKSIEEIYENEQKDPTKAIKKIKLEPHKFKDNTSKSLVYKYNEALTNTEFDDPSMLPFSQQKKLNQRNQYRRMQKDPFIMIQKKDKTHERTLEKDQSQ